MSIKLNKNETTHGSGSFNHFIRPVRYKPIYSNGSCKPIYSYREFILENTREAVTIANTRNGHFRSKTCRDVLINNKCDLFECMTFEMLNKSQQSFVLPVGSLIILYCLFNPYIISVGLSHWRYLWVSTSCILFNQVDDLSWESHIFSRKKHAKPLKNCQKRDVSDWIFWIFFVFFSVRDSFFPQKINVTPHFWPWKTTTWPQGWRRWSNIWHMELMSIFIFFMWCDVQRFPSFFLLSWLLCCQRGHPLDRIEYMKLILINIFSETVLRRWFRDWIDSTK